MRFFNTFSRVVLNLQINNIVGHGSSLHCIMSLLSPLVLHCCIIFQVVVYSQANTALAYYSHYITF